METRRLEYFHALAQDGNFSRTAARLRMSQPALSQQIQRLEAEIGAHLVDRTARPMALTEVGARLLEQSAGALEHMRAIDLLRTAASRGETGTLRIGLIPMVLFSQIPQQIRTFRRAFPDVNLSLHQLDTAPLMDALEAGRVDLALLTATPGTRGVRYHNLRTDPVSVVLPDDHPLAGHNAIKLQQLRDEPLIMFPRQSASDNFDRVITACMHAGFSPHIITETGGYAAQIGYVAAGMGFALVPPDIDRVHHKGVVRIPLTSPNLTLTTRVAWLPAKLNSHVQTFLSTVTAGGRQPSV